MAGKVHATGNFPELLYPGLSTIWGTEYEQHQAVYEKFMQVEDSTQNFEKEQGMTGFGLASVKNQGDEVPYKEAVQGFQKEYRHVTYGIGAIITREMVEDDLYNYISQIPALLARSMRHTEETIATNVYNNAFNASFAGADGVSFISTAHPNAGDGDTQSNRPSTAADLSQTSLEQAIIDIMDYRDDQGLRLQVMGKKLLIPRSEYFNASEILQTEYKTDSADNNKNIISNIGMELVVTNFLTDQDAWFVLTDVINGAKFKRRRKAEIQRDNDFDTENLKIKTTTRFSTGFTDWRAVYGSPGA